MSTNKLTHFSQSSAPLVVERPDAGLISKNRKIKQAPVCKKISSALKKVK